MKPGNILRSMVFYYKYLLVFTAITSVFGWFDGSIAACLLLLIFLLIPYFLCYLLYGKSDKVKTDASGREVSSVCHLEFLYPVCLLVILGGAYRNWPSTLLCFILFLCIMGLYFSWKIYQGRYTVLYCNPSVSQETGRRAGAGLQRGILRLGIIALILSFAFFFLEGQLPSYSLPLRKMDQKQTEKKKTKEREKMESGKSPKQEKPPEPEETLALLIFRYVAKWFVILVLIAGAVAFLYGIFLFITRRHRRDGMEYREQMSVERDNEQYTKLVPVTRKKISFPEGNAGEVRKIFYREVKSGAGAGKIDPSKTSEELQEDYLAEKEGANLLVQVYQRARYGEEPVSDRDLESVRHMR